MSTMGGPVKRGPPYAVGSFSASRVTACSGIRLLLPSCNQAGHAEVGRVNAALCIHQSARAALMRPRDVIRFVPYDSAGLPG